jgi:hypothetical protein
MLPIGDQTPQNLQEWLPIILALAFVLACVCGLVLLGIKIVVG